MINPVFLLSGIGMMIAAGVPVFWWRYRTLTSWRLFALGAGSWFIAIALKVAMDLTVTPLLVSWLSGIYTALGMAIITGAYVGLRTGIFESGFSYFIVIRAKLRSMTFDQAIAFGIGFGAVEAFLIGMSSFMNVSVIIAFPQILELLTAAQKAALLQQLSLPAIVAASPVIERIFTMAVHVFCSVLVVQSLKTGKVRYFIVSFLFKTILDGMLPFMTMTYGTSTAEGIFAIESFVMIMGLMSLAGLYLIRNSFGKNPRKKAPDSRAAMFVALVVLLSVSAAFYLAQPATASQLERRPVTFDGFSGKYDFIMNDSVIGTSEFEFTNGLVYNGMNAFAIEELTNLSTDDFEMVIEGTLYTTVDARPLFYNSTIILDGRKKQITCEFFGSYVEQTERDGNNTERRKIAVSNDSFIIANNMISHWALLFRAADLDSQNTYITRMYSPNVGMDIVRTLEVSSVENITINGNDYDVYVFSDQFGNNNYVTPEGVLLAVKSDTLEITISDGHQSEEGEIFR